MFCRFVIEVIYAIDFGFGPSTVALNDWSLYA